MFGLKLNKYEQFATATQNFKWDKVTHIYLISYQTFANRDVYKHIDLNRLINRIKINRIKVVLNSVSSASNRTVSIFWEASVTER